MQNVPYCVTLLPTQLNNSLITHQMMQSYQQMSISGSVESWEKKMAVIWMLSNIKLLTLAISLLFLKHNQNLFYHV
jgi:hypothetical protein